MYKEVILDYIFDYLKLKGIPYKKSGKVIMLNCPYCKNEEKTATIIPNTSIINCFECEKKYNLIDLVKKIESEKLTFSEEEILQYLKELFDINVVTEKEEKEIEKLLDYYIKERFNLVPIAKNAKNPVEKDWTNQDHRNKEEWKNWLNNGLNIGVKTGKRSNITVIDIDTKEIPNLLKNVNTLIQETKKGYHYFFQYEEDLPKCRIDELNIDIENDGGQVVITPSIVENVKRKFNNLSFPIIKMSPEIKTFLKEKTTVPRKTRSELVKEDIQSEDFNLQLLKEGSRNDSLIRLGGLFRKELSLNQTYYVLNILNKHACEKPLEDREIRGMINSLDKYIDDDEQDIAHKILEYLRLIESATKTDIEIVITGNQAKGELKKRIDKIINSLIKEQYIGRRGRYYHLIKKADWKENLISVGNPINFKMPYFHDVGIFNWGDLILIGSKAKYGKTHISMNIVQKLVKQGIKPYYISLETGSRFTKIALQLGLKEGDFKWDFCADPTKIELEKNAVTIIDWLLVIDKAKTDLVFRHFIEQLDKNKGLLIIFQQLKHDGSWFAPNMCKQFPSLATRYLYENEGDGTYGKFTIEEVREPTQYGKKTFELPCIYDWQSKELKRLDEKE